VLCVGGAFSASVVLSTQQATTASEATSQLTTKMPEYVASTSMDRTLGVWDAANLGRALTLRGHSDAAASVCALSSPELVASGSWDRTVRVWTTKGGSCVSTLKGHTDEVNAVCALGCDGRLASGGDDGTVRVWDVVTPSGGGSSETTKKAPPPCVVATLDHGKHRVRCVAAVEDIVVSGAEDGVVRLWKKHAAEEPSSSSAGGYAVASTLAGPGTSSVTAVTTCGDRVVSCDLDGNSRVWDLGTGKLTSRFAGSVVNDLATFPHRPNLVATATEGRECHVFDVKSGAVVKSLYDQHRGAVTAVAVLPASGHLVTGSRDKTIQVIDFIKGTIHHKAAHAGGITGLVAMELATPPSSSPPSRDGTTIHHHNKHCQLM